MLVDSEALSDDVLAGALTGEGLPTTLAQARREITKACRSVRVRAACIAETRTSTRRRLGSNGSSRLLLGVEKERGVWASAWLLVVRSDRLADRFPALASHGSVSALRMVVTSL